MGKIIEGLKLIRANSYRVNNPDDPSFPFRLDVCLSPPAFLDMAFIGIIGGSEELTVRGMTKEALEEFAQRNGIDERHPRLRWAKITKPGEGDLVVKEWKR